MKNILKFGRILKQKKESPTDAKEYEGVENKFEKYFSEKGAE